jgi:L-threonylcarbamoyladenylate synthase
VAGDAKILEPTEAAINLVADALLRGEIVALPTETVYGLAAIISNEDALQKIFAAKRRPSWDPLIVHVLNLSALRDLVEVEGNLFHKLRLLSEAFCPGPLTFVLKKKKNVANVISAGKKTIAIRIPAHSVFREVLKKTGPLAAPSANPFGYISPTCAAHVYQSLGNEISYILDGGPCEVGLESTILDLSVQPLMILRPGVITVAMIENILGEKIKPYHPLVSADPSAPGMLKQHYSPRTRLRLFRKSIKEIIDNFPEYSMEDIAIVYLSSKEAHASGEVEHGLKENVFWFSEEGDLHEVARNMFAILQQLDGMQFHLICCQIPEAEHMGIAVIDRLSRAAAKF